ncbi:MAG: lipopolysaccharide assembly protein LapA domain-containing protein [Acidimicrobiales bacterium]
MTSSGDEETGTPELGDGDEHATPPRAVIASTRTSRLWLRLLPSLVVLVVILVFIVQNHQDVRVSLFTLAVTWPLSIALLASAILGALLVLAIGSLRIVQLRRQIRRRPPPP